MPIREALIIEAGGERFRSYYDLDVPEVLHIAQRHGTTPGDAIRTFFEGERRPWDEARQRFETQPTPTASTGRATHTMARSS